MRRPEDFPLGELGNGNGLFWDVRVYTGLLNRGEAFRRWSLEYNRVNGRELDERERSSRPPRSKLTGVLAPQIWRIRAS